MQFVSFPSRATAIVGALALASSCIGYGSGTSATPKPSTAVVTASAVASPAAAQLVEEPAVVASVTEISTTAGAPPTKAAGAWGSLAGQFILEGDIPAVEVTVNMKEPICSKEIPSDELTVNKDNKGIADIFVYIPTVKKPPVHPDLKASKDKEVVLDQKGCHFVPHALVLRTDQKLMIKSMDEFNHNTRTAPIKNEAINVTVTPKNRDGVPWKVTVPELLPTQIKCDIHSWMGAYCLVIDHPYAVVSDKDGKFELKNVPAGELEFRYWHSKVGYVEKTVKLTIKAGGHLDLGKIKVPVAKFTETK